MAKTIANPKIEAQQLDVEHELPAADDTPEKPTPVQQARGEGSPAWRADLEKVRAERDSLADRIARQQAEFENAHKRAAREQQEFKDFALADTLSSLLPVLDSLEQALRAPTQKVEELRSGVELIRKQWLDAMSKLGLRPIQAAGGPFDPRLHEAIEIQDTEEAKDSQVLEELQRGYMLGDRLLRPAWVRVSRNTKSQSSEDQRA